MTPGKTICKDCIHQSQGIKCKIFLQSCAMMETILYDRLCCFKRVKK